MFAPKWCKMRSRKGRCTKKCEATSPLTGTDAAEREQRVAGTPTVVKAQVLLGYTGGAHFVRLLGCARG